MNDFRLRSRERLAKSREWIDKRNPRRFELVLLICLVVGLTGIVASVFVPSLLNFTQGRAASRTVIASKTVTAIDSVATQDLKSQVAKLVEPVLVADPQALTQATYDLEAFFQAAGSLRSQLGSGPSGTAGPLTLEAARSQLRAAAQGTVTDQTLDFLLSASNDVFDLTHQQALGALRAVYADQITASSLETAKTHLKTITNTLTASSDEAAVIYDVAAAYVRHCDFII